MLLKDGEIYKLTADNKKDLKKKFPKLPVKLMYPKSRIVRSTSPHNTKPDKPASISFPLIAVVKTEMGSTTWRYTENMFNDVNGNLKYIPNSFTLRGNSISLDEKDADLLWWLWKYCPYLEGGENYNGRPAKCVFEDKASEAKAKADHKAEIAEVNAIIYSPKLGLGEEKLRTIAKAYFVNDVDEMTFPQVQLAVESKINSDKVNGIKDFLELIDSESTLEVRANITKAIDMGLIKFDVRNKAWVWVTKQGMKNEQIAKIAPNANPNYALYDLYMGNRNFAEQLVSSIKGERVILNEDNGGTPDE